MFAIFRGLFSRKPAATGTTTAKGAVQDRARLLARIPLFIDLGQRDLQTLATTSIQRDYAAGETVLRQGAPGEGLFVIVRGRVRVTQPEGSTERELAELGEGEVFGEQALLDELPRSATVTSLEPTSVLIVPVAEFRLALRNDPDIGIRLLATMARRLRRAESQQI